MAATHSLVGTSYDGDRRYDVCPHCDKELKACDIYKDAKGWLFCRRCFRKGKGLIKKASVLTPSIDECVEVLAEMEKCAVGANSFRIAQLMHGLSSIPERLMPFMGKHVGETASNLSRLLGRVVGRESPEWMQQTAARELTSKLQPPAAPLATPNSINPLETDWTNQSMLQRLLSGRHGSDRQVFTGSQLKAQLPQPGPNTPVAYRTALGSGTPFVNKGTATGSPLFVTGHPEVALGYKIPALQSTIGSSSSGPYLQSLNQQALESAGPAGPWGMHYGEDTRSGPSRIMANLMNHSGPVGRGIVSATRGGSIHASPYFERTFTDPGNLAGATDQSFKYLGQTQDSPEPLFMRVANKPFKQAALALPVGDHEQQKDYSCGPAAVKATAEGLTGDADPESKIMHDAGSSAEDGTRPIPLVEAAKKQGLNAEASQMTIETLKAQLAQGHHVVCAIQQTDDEKDKLKNENGHYVVVCGCDETNVKYHDPASGTIKSLPNEEFVKRWHDQDGDGKPYVRLGIALWPADSVMKSTQDSLQKSAQAQLLDECDLPYDPEEFVIKEAVDTVPDPFQALEGGTDQQTGAADDTGASANVFTDPLKWKNIDSAYQDSYARGGAGRIKRPSGATPIGVSLGSTLTSAQPAQVKEAIGNGNPDDDLENLINPNVMVPTATTLAGVGLSEPTALERLRGGGIGLGTGLGAVGGMNLAKYLGGGQNTQLLGGAGTGLLAYLMAKKLANRGHKRRLYVRG